MFILALGDIMRTLSSRLLWHPLQISSVSSPDFGFYIQSWLCNKQTLWNSLQLRSWICIRVCILHHVIADFFESMYTRHTGRRPQAFRFPMMRSTFTNTLCLRSAFFVFCKNELRQSNWKILSLWHFALICVIRCVVFHNDIISYD